MKDGFNAERNEDRLWPWVFGAVILLGAGGGAVSTTADGGAAGASMVATGTSSAGSISGVLSRKK